MPVRVSQWYGRLGNNIRQVVNALSYALANGDSEVRIPPHTFFRRTALSTGVAGPAARASVCDTFFAARVEAAPECLPIVRGAFSPVAAAPVHGLATDDLVIHIRAGDIFGPRPHPLYVQPPLAFYRAIVGSGGRWASVRIVAEDDKNPCVGALLALYPQIAWEKQALEKDVDLILSARTLVSSFGTFVAELVKFNPVVDVVYDVSYAAETYFHDRPIERKTLDLGEYRAKMGDWENTREQRNLMLGWEFPEGATPQIN